MVRSGLVGEGLANNGDSVGSALDSRCWPVPIEWRRLLHRPGAPGDPSTGLPRPGQSVSHRVAALDHGARRLARLIPVGRQCQPHRPQHRDELPLHAQARVRFVVRAGERPLVGALE